MLKKLAIFFTVFTFSLSLSLGGTLFGGVASASTGTTVGEKVPIMEAGWVYYPSTDSKYKKTEFSHTHTNSGSTTDSVSYSVAVTRAASANTTVSASLKGMIAQAGVSTQVAWSSSKTTTLTITWSIPAHSTYLLTAGSSWAKASGTQKYYNQYGTVTSQSSVNGNWTYSSWSAKSAQ